MNYTDSHVGTLYSELRALRRRYRLLVVGLVGIGLLLGLGAMRAGPADLTLEAHAIKLYDDAGQVYAAFGENENGRGRGLTLYAADGVRYATFGQTNLGQGRGPGLTMYAADGTPYAVLGPTKLGYGLRLFAADGTMLTELDVTRVHEPNVPRLTMHDARGVPRIGMACERWPSITLADERQNGRMEMYAHEDSAGIGFKDGTEEVQVGMLVTGKEGHVFINASDQLEGWRAPRKRIEQVEDGDDDRDNGDGSK